jgi:hypothetical protein
MMGSRANPRDERGATAVLVAISLVALMGMVVLVVDLGSLLVLRRRMVNAADAAALAAAESCALGQGRVQAGSGANALATRNVAVAKRDGGLVFDGTCDEGTGTVTVRYVARQSLFFAPVLGFASHSTVAATAKASWQPAGNAKPLPIQLNLDWLKEQCHIPSPEIGTECDFWYDNADLGNAQWGYMNLDQWNVSPSFGCSNTGSSTRSDWIHHDYPDFRVLNGTPPGSEPTYACADSGHSSRDWMDLRDEVGTIKFFPVNDPSGQLDNSGAVAPPPATPDKYDIVGFAALYIRSVLKGDNPNAVGLPGDAGSCSGTNSFTTTPPANVLVLDTLGCTGLGVSNLKLSSGPSLSPTVYQEGVDYSFDPALHEVTWLRNEAVADVRVDWDWATPGSGGKCGARPSDPNAICLVTIWKGYRVGGVAGGGQDLGLRVIRLTG